MIINAKFIVNENEKPKEGYIHGFTHDWKINSSKVFVSEKKTGVLFCLPITDVFLNTDYQNATLDEIYCILCDVEAHVKYLRDAAQSGS
jgi:hypothetical protein